MAPKRKLKQISKLKKTPTANLYQAQIREIRKQKCINFHNYSPDWYVWHYLKLKCQMSSNVFLQWYIILLNRDE